MKNRCLCCGKEIPAGLFQLSSCIECIKASCSGVALYTVDGSPRWCNVHNQPAEQLERATETEEPDF